MTVREFLRTVWAGKYLVLAAVVLVVAGAYVYLDRQETHYRSTATVELSSVESSQGGDQLVAVTVASDVEDATSPPVVEAAAVTLGRTPAQVTGLVQADYASEDGKTVTVSATTLDPRDAQQVANAVAEAYVARVGVLQGEQVAALDARRQALAEQLTGVRARLVANPDDPLALAEQETIVSEYTALTVQLNTLSAIAPPAVVKDPATAGEPLGASRGTVLAVALLAGLVMGVGLAFARRGLDIRVRSSAEAARLADAPVLAELYGTKGAVREFGHAGSLPVSSKVASPFTESIRELRTAVQVSVPDASRTVVVVTSADPHPPRAFIAANLAASFALSGRRTVAVSGDLRRPQLDRMLPPPEGWDGAVHQLRPTAVPNLHVFPVPEEEMDPADYLATDRARALVDGLHRDAEVVVIDAPPVLAAADATILGGYASGVVLIAAAGRTDRAVLTEAAARLRLSNVELLGIALSGVTGDRRMAYASTYGEDESGQDDGGDAAPPTGAAEPVPAQRAERPREAARTARTADGPLLSPAWSKVPAVVPTEAPAAPAGDEDAAPDDRRRPFRW